MPIRMHTIPCHRVASLDWHPCSHRHLVLPSLKGDLHGPGHAGDGDEVPPAATREHPFDLLADDALDRARPQTEASEDADPFVVAVAHVRDDVLLPTGPSGDMFDGPVEALLEPRSDASTLADQLLIGALDEDLREIHSQSRGNRSVLSGLRIGITVGETIHRLALSDR